MANVLSTYSGKDTNITLNNPLTGTVIQMSGIAEQGLAEVIIRMSVDQSSLQVGMDGAVVPSVIPGDQGEIELQVWQTSTLHQQLLTWYNTLKTQRDLGIVSPWFAASVFILSTVDGSSHTATGVGPKKVPDKTYAEQAGRVSWVLACANIINESGSVGAIVGGIVGGLIG